MKTFRNDTPTARRSGFTLVELLVAAALTVLIMTVLATAFQTGMQTLSTLKSVVGLSEQLRTAESILRNDLGGVHLESPLGDPVRVSQQNVAWVSPYRGYFAVVHGSKSTASNFVYEGDEEKVYSYRATDHSLFFTTKRTGETKQDVYYGDMSNLTALFNSNQSLTDYAVNNNQFASKWAEIGYFLVPLSSNLMTNDENATLTKLNLYTLNRRQRAIAPYTVALPLPGNLNPNAYLASYPEISISGLSRTTANPAVYEAFVNDPDKLTDINNRMMKQFTYNGNTPAAVTGNATVLDTLFPKLLAIPSGSDKTGSDIVLNNVISMQIRVVTSGSGQLLLDDLPTAVAVTTTPRSLDTATPTTTTVIRAIQIKLRVWDTKNSITRQITITQDL